MSKQTDGSAGEKPVPECILLNEVSGVVSHSATRKFIAAINDELHGGYAFVPLIGAGFSVSAGIPIIKQLEVYLQRCICMALGATRTKIMGQQLWNPRTDQWPPFTDHEPNDQLWSDLVYLEYQDRKSDRDKDPKIFQEAFGAMSEWRTALLFLSRLEQTPRRCSVGSPYRLSLGFPIQETIDSCFREVMRNKHPSLNHTMLGALSGLLRIDLILSTNFDNLLEQAFEETRNPLQVFEVHLGGHLPDRAAISRVRALVKLHGSLHSLRADYTLDSSPSLEDLQTFVKYLEKPGASSGTAKSQALGKEKCERHLLVFGVSANEKRTLEYIKGAWKRLRDFKVFWVCYDVAQIEKVQAFVKSYVDEHPKEENADGSPRRLCYILHHTEIGLLLLHLYQDIRKSIPSVGTVFPSVTRIPLPMLPSSSWISGLQVCKDPEGMPALASTSNATSIPSSTAVEVPENRIRYESLVDSQSKRLKGKCGEIEFVEKAKRDQEASLKFSHDLNQEFDRRQAMQYKLILVASHPDVHGIASACSEFFRAKQTGNSCLWIDMTDIYSANNLFEVLLEAAYFKLGQENWAPLFTSRPKSRSTGAGGRRASSRTNDETARATEIKRIQAAAGSPWIIFLNARETPGSNGPPVESPPNGWLDVEKPQQVNVPKPPDYFEDDSDNMAEFIALLEELCGQQGGLITVVLMCCDVKSPIVLHLKSRSQVDPVILESEGASVVNSESVATKAIQWALPTDVPEESEHRQRFLHALTLMQRSRLLGTAWDGCVNVQRKDSKKSIYLQERSNWSSEFDARKDAWLEELEDIDLLRWKDGGFIWLHARHRKKVREFLKGVPHLRRDATGMVLLEKLSVSQQAGLEKWAPEQKEAEIHSSLVFWYRKVLDATASPSAIFEAVDHMCLSAVSFLKTNVADRQKLAENQVRSASKLLQSRSFLIQTHGYPRGSIRRLLRIRDFFVKDEQGLIPAEGKLVEAIRELQLICVAVMRGVAREVGEDGEAYYWHREYYERKLSPESLTYTPVKKGKGLAARLAGKLSRAEWLHWWRWCAMLAIASRSLQQAESALCHGLSATIEQAENPNKHPHFKSYRKEDRPKLRFEPEFVKKLGRAITKDFENLDERAILEVLRILEACVHLLLLKASLDRRMKEKEKKTNWDLPLAFATYALDLSESIRSGSNFQDSRTILNAAWCKSRLLMHMSILSREDSKSDNPHRHPMGFLGDAEACLSASDPGRHRADLALVELHRAECRLHEAAEVEILGQGQKLGQWSFRLLDFSQDEGILSATKAALEAQSADFEMKLRLANAWATEALRFLDRAEPILRGRRRNVWWTTWFFERRLRAIALTLCLSLFDPDETPIPFLGFEAAMYGSHTEIDLLLGDAVRMIRVDQYRLATVIQAYAICARALQLRLKSSRTNIQMPERLGGMAIRMRLAAESLGAVRSRQPSLTGGTKKVGEVDQFVSDVMANATEVAKSLEDQARQHAPAIGLH